MNEQIKRDHHYVPRFYLKRWTTKATPTHLWCLDKKKLATQHDKIKLVSTKSTSVKDSLYKFTGLNPLELRIIWSLTIEHHGHFTNAENCQQIKELTEQEVNFYNKFILDNAEQYVYANNKQDLENLITT